MSKEVHIVHMEESTKPDVFDRVVEAVTLGFVPPPSEVTATLSNGDVVTAGTVGGVAEQVREINEARRNN